MIFTDREIRIALDKGQIKISPIPSPEAFSSTSVDLTLDPILTVYKSQTAGVERTIDPAAEGLDHEAVLAELTDQINIPDDGYVLDQRHLILGWTAERIDLPLNARLAARVEGKSSLARFGLGVHLTAPTIHAGFGGRIRLEIVNNNSVPIRLNTGMRICQLIFELTLGTPDQGYQGQFLDQ
ncbi:MAG: dCTP deaminase [Proteobacteria bacterium]|nr:dCTP deaminase [Pseudomonadota bacterium]